MRLELSLFERSEFFFFRERVKILASEREPANFFGQVLNNSSFCFFFFVRTKEKEKPLRMKDMQWVIGFEFVPVHHSFKDDLPLLVEAGLICLEEIHRNRRMKTEAAREQKLSF